LTGWLLGWIKSANCWADRAGQIRNL